MAVLPTNYLDILTHYPDGPEASTDKASAEWYVFGWVWRLLKTDKPAAIAILHHLRQEGFSTAGQILKRLPAIDLATFTPAFSYRIEK